MGTTTFKDFLNKRSEKSNKGTYAGVRFSEESVDKIMEVASEIINPINREDVHCTLLYSRKYLPDYEPNGEILEKATVNGFKIFETQDNKRALVLTLDSPYLEKRHKQLMEEHDATYDYDEYIPHITISYDIEDRQIDEIDFKETLVIIQEYKEDLKLDWKSENKES